MSIPKTLVVMGVAGCGKSSIGAGLAERLGGIFEDGDDFHPAENKAKMIAGIPLNDEDRQPWLEKIRERIVEVREVHPETTFIVGCSALKQKYRDILQGDDSIQDFRFIYLNGTRELIAQRMGARTGHFMPTSLLDSQFATLEEPTDAIVVDIAPNLPEIIEAIAKELNPV